MALQWPLSSLRRWFIILLWLNLLDILVTNPAYEANPFTLYLWGKIGFFLSAWVKIGLVLIFGALCICVKRIAKPMEWEFSSKLLGGILVVLVIFYLFVVTWNSILRAIPLFL
jgi:hypothetical protein